MKLLLLSNSTMPGQPFFTWPKPYVSELIKAKTRVLFIPYAAVTFSFDEYTSAVKNAFGDIGIEVCGIHQENSPAQALRDAGVIVTGGGNTFALLARLCEHNLLPLMRERIQHGVPYIGWSAGANIACPTIMTTNDMPIIQPPSFEALQLIPYQINPHYTEYKAPGHGGETRMQRIEEFLTVNPASKVIGLPEGMLLHGEQQRLVLKGTGTARLFSNTGVEELSPGRLL